MKRMILISMAAVLASSIWAITSAHAQQFSPWSPAVNLGPSINTNFNESCVTVSKKGLTLIFASSRPGGWGGNDLYVAQRASAEDPWGAPQNLGININSGANDQCPALSLDEHRLYFASRRPGCGGTDIYVSRRHDRRDDFGWEPAQNLGCTSDGYVNSLGDEATPAFFEDEEGSVVMYFSLRSDICASMQREDGSFGPGEVVAELNTPSNEHGATIRRDGLEVIFSSDRPGGLGGNDLWMATRHSTRDPWSTPVHLDDYNVNSPFYDGGRMNLSFDGLTLHFMSERQGGFGSRDLYFTTRTKLKGMDAP